MLGGYRPMRVVLGWRAVGERSNVTREYVHFEMATKVSLDSHCNCEIDPDEITRCEVREPGGAALPS